MGRQKLIHIHSSKSNTPPTKGQLEFGEIAVNYADGSEKLYIKNNKKGPSGEDLSEIVGFVNDNEFNEKERVTAVALSNLNDTKADKNNPKITGKINDTVSIKDGGNAVINIDSTSANKDFGSIYVSDPSSNTDKTRPLVLQNGYGNVGIDVIAPTHKLQVNGNIYASGQVYSNGKAVLTSQTVSKNVVGASETATKNAKADNGSVHLNHLEDSVVKSSHIIKGVTNASVTSEENGNISISTPNVGVTSTGSGTYVKSIKTTGHGIEYTLGTPPNTNTHLDSNIWVGTSGTAANEKVDSNPYIKVGDSGVYKNQIKLIQGDNAYIKSDASGNITISAKDTTYATRPNPHALTIQRNGTTITTYDGSSAKTANIKVPTTPGDIGAAPASHTHPYLSTSGGNLSGNLTFNNIANTDRYIRFGYGTSDTDAYSWKISYLGTGSADDNNLAFQSNGSGKWVNALKFGLTTYNATFAGNIIPAATNTKTIGTSSLKWKDVYATTLHGNLDWSYITGEPELVTKKNGIVESPLKFNDTSLPSKQLDFVCGIDLFEKGGEMGWESADSFVQRHQKDNNTTYSLSGTNDTVTLTGSDKSTSSHKVNNVGYAYNAGKIDNIDSTGLLRADGGQQLSSGADLNNLKTGTYSTSQTSIVSSLKHAPSTSYGECVLENRYMGANGHILQTFTGKTAASKFETYYRIFGGTWSEWTTNLDSKNTYFTDGSGANNYTIGTLTAGDKSYTLSGQDRNVTSVDYHYKPVKTTTIGPASGTVITGLGVDAAGHVVSATGTNSIANATNATNTTNVAMNDGTVDVDRNIWFNVSSTAKNVSGNVQTASSTNLTFNPVKNELKIGGVKVPTTTEVDSQINAKIAANDAMLFKGIVDGTHPLPANHEEGWTYKVGGAGTYAGKVCEVGDMIICITKRSTANDNDWTVLQNNIDGAVTGPTSATDGHFALFNGTTGKIIKNSSYTTGSFVKKSGDAMTGKLTLQPNIYTDAANTGALNLSNSNIYGINGLYFADTAENGAEGINFYNSSTKVDSLWSAAGVLKYTPNRAYGDAGTTYTVAHAGNTDYTTEGYDDYTIGTLKIAGETFTLKGKDKNTWRGITDSYSGISTEISLSQKGANALYNTLVNGYASSAGTATNATQLNAGSATNPSLAAEDLKAKWYKITSTNSGAEGFAGDATGFHVDNNANGILWLGCHSSKFGGQLGISSDSRMYYRYITSGSFPESAGTWKKVAYTSDYSISEDPIGVVVVSMNGTTKKTYTKEYIDSMTIDCGEYTAQ